MEGSAYYCELEFLKQQNSLPILLNIKDDNDLNHFVLLIEFNNKKLRILDPALKLGNRELTWKWMETHYLGQILTFRKTKKWQPQIPWKFLFGYINKYWTWLFLITMATIASNYLWFLTGFFIRILELWSRTNTINYWNFIEYFGYFSLGSVFYLLQSQWSIRLRQLLWSQIVAEEIKDLEVRTGVVRLENGFWETIANQHQTVSSFFSFITKFLNQTALLPLVVWIVFKTSLWILVIYALFIICNAVINHIALRFYHRTQDEAEWKKSVYHQQLAFYLSNLSNLRRRQYHKIHSSILKENQGKYFQSERKHNFWLSLTDLNQQLTQRIFGLAFWFLVFAFLLRTTNPINDLLILSLTLQLSLSFTIDLVHNWFLFWHQRSHIYNLKALTTRKILSHHSSASKNSLESLIQFRNFGFETPGHFFTLKNATFRLPLQILGSKPLLDAFYQACLVAKSQLIINSLAFQAYENQFFAIDDEATPIALTVADNLFLGNPIDKNLVKLINLKYWLTKYELDLTNQVNLAGLGKAQLQVLSFLSLLLSNYEVYFLSHALSAVSIKDQESLWELLFKIKKGSALVIYGEIPRKMRVQLTKMKLEEML